VPKELEPNVNEAASIPLAEAGTHIPTVATVAPFWALAGRQSRLIPSGRNRIAFVPSHGHRNEKCPAYKDRGEITDACDTPLAHAVALPVFPLHSGPTAPTWV